MPRTHRTHRILHLLACLLLGCALAAPAGAAGGSLGPEWAPIDVDRLDGMRGGFVGPRGFVVSFGIERVVSINGEVVASTRLQIPDVTRLTAEQAQALASLRDSQVIHVGAGTRVAGGAQALVIQNTLDGQTISARTSLDVSLNTLQLYRDTQLGALITGALTGRGPSL
ncbi:hypothetical protein [Lysobacter sp. N42]|uniref:hypothetical protein n=1 Tax=Lysobacter sp. N42 TaxID=2545719 RepID=UPI0010431B84|nr:hypothetical protein [Lysobacter sp. N42]TCZ82015.1 hypothetical protein EYQ95_23575 [Lysobacter sp. N42]